MGKSWQECVNWQPATFCRWVLLTLYIQHGWMSDRLPHSIVHFTYVHSFIWFLNMAKVESSRQQFCPIWGYCATRLMPCYLRRGIAHCTTLQCYIWTYVKEQILSGAIANVNVWY
jgi:hypothetical protein